MFPTSPSKQIASAINRLRESAITHISFVFNEDMVNPDRKIPWRAQLSISRMKKDLKCIPLFQSLDEEGFRTLRKQVIRGVLRPIKKPDLMAALLLNADLARTNEVSEQEIEDEVLADIAKECLVETGQEALRAHPATQIGHEPEGRKRALVKLYRRLRSSEVEGAEELIRQLFDKGIIEFRSLPEDIQQRLTIEMETNRFLQERTQMLVLYQNADSAEIHRARGEYLLRIIPELLRRDLLDEVLLLAKAFRAQSSLGGFRGPNATRILGKIHGGEIGTLFKARFRDGKKEDRIALAPIFLALEHAPPEHPTSAE